MNYLLTALSSFVGAMVAILVWTTYQRIQRMKALQEIQKEFFGKIQTEITFQKLAEQLRTEMGNDLD